MTIFEMWIGDDTMQLERLFKNKKIVKWERVKLKDRLLAVDFV